jgi:hypothetical protein
MGPPWRETCKERSAQGVQVQESWMSDESRARKALWTRARAWRVGRRGEKITRDQAHWQRRI